MDNDSKVIHSAEFTTANVHDFEMFENVLHKQENMVMADKAYASKKLKDKYTRKGVTWSVMEKAYSVIH